MKKSIHRGMARIAPVLLSATLLAPAISAERGALILRAPETDLYTQPTAMSANGEWVCGMADQDTPMAFVWNTITGEMRYLTANDVSQAYGVSNDGKVVGCIGSDERACYWDSNYDIHILNNKQYGVVYGISPNGEHMVGQFGSGMYAVYWDAAGNITSLKAPTTSKGQKSPGMARDITADGKHIIGWTYGPVKTNRTVTQWNSEDPTQKDWAWQFPDPDVTENMYCYGSKYSENGEWFVYAYGRGKTDGSDYQTFTFCEVYSIANDGSAVGQFEGNAVIVLPGDLTPTNLQDYLTERGCDFGDITLVNCTSISGDGKSFACTAEAPAVINGESYVRYFPVVILLDQELDCRPAANISAYQLNGVKAASVQWLAPLGSAEGLKSYTISRNGEHIATPDADETLFVDKNLENGTYTYSIVANYLSGTSEAVECSVEIANNQVNAPTDFRAVKSGWKDLRLLWNDPRPSAPVISHYRNGDLESFGYGVTFMEAALRFPKQQIAAYGDEVKVSAVTIFPETAFSDLTVNLYEVGATEPFASATADLSTLRVNHNSTLALSEPLSIPTDKDVVVGFAITALATDGTLMKAYYGDKRIGYTDLVRLDDEEFFSLYDASMNSENGAYEYTLTWPMGLVTESESTPTLEKYILSCNDTQLAETTERSYTQESLENGTYNYTLSALYSNNEQASVTLKNDFSRNINALKGVDSFSHESDELNLSLNWEAPVVDNSAEVTYANGSYADAITAGDDNYGYDYQASVIFRTSMFDDYEGYSVSGLRFYPTTDCDYTLSLYENGTLVGEVETFAGEGDYTVGEWNTLSLDAPVALKSGVSYQMVVDCFNVPAGEAAVAYDDSTVDAYYSDLFRFSDVDDFESLTSDEEVDGFGAWMMGVAIISDDYQETTPDYYDVYIDGKKSNEAQIADTQYDVELAEFGSFTVRVDSHYDGNRVKGTPATVVLVSGVKNPEGVAVKSYTLYNTNGVCLGSSNSAAITTASQLTPGTYVVVLNYDNGTSKTVKFIHK